MAEPAVPHAVADPYRRPRRGGHPAPRAGRGGQARPCSTRTASPRWPRPSVRSGSTPRPGGDRPWTGRRSSRSSDRACAATSRPSQEEAPSSQAAARPAATGRTIPRRRHASAAVTTAPISTGSRDARSGSATPPASPAPTIAASAAGTAWSSSRRAADGSRGGRQQRDRRDRNTQDIAPTARRTATAAVVRSTAALIEHGADRDARDDPGQQPELARE